MGAGTIGRENCPKNLPCLVNVKCDSATLFIAMRLKTSYLFFQVEELKLSPGTGGTGFDRTYSSLSGLVFTSTGAPDSADCQFARLFDGNIRNAYIVASSQSSVQITVSLPWTMHIHHVRLYPVGLPRSKFFAVPLVWVGRVGRSWEHVRVSTPESVCPWLPHANPLYCV